MQSSAKQRENFSLTRINHQEAYKFAIIAIEEMALARLRESFVNLTVHRQEWILKSLHNGKDRFVALRKFSKRSRVGVRGLFPMNRSESFKDLASE